MLARRFFLFYILQMVALTACLRTSDTPGTSGSSGVSLPECPLNQSTLESCTVTETARYVTATLGTNINVWQNQGSTTSIYASIPTGFYSNRVVAFSEPLLVAQNIRYGVTIFGVAGTDPGVLSTAARDKGYAQLAASTETTTYAGQNLPASGGYSFREVPKISQDDDGTVGGTVTYVNRTSPLDWSGRTCGLSGTLEQRIADCAIQLGTEATWVAASRGHGGEANWKIVSRTGDCASVLPNRSCREVWKDMRTGLLWSSRLSEAINWCRASGSNNAAGNPQAEVDPSSICDQSGNQSTFGLVISACFEDGGTSFTSSHASITNLSGKGSLGKMTAPAVAWRLPTLSDYSAANVDGLRFILPDAGATGLTSGATSDWTSTVDSSNRAQAWIFNGNSGTSSLANRGSTSAGVRCVGR